MQPLSLFRNSESGFFTCVRVRPPPEGEVATEPAVLVTGTQLVSLSSSRTNVRTGEARESDPSSFPVDGAFDFGASDDAV